MRISELARRTGASPHALRHYEELGLLLPARTAGGYRDYPEDARREVIFITMSRRIGMSLKEIGEFLPAYRARRLSPADYIDALQKRVADIDAAIAKLQAQRARTVDHIAWMRARSAPAKPSPSPRRKAKP